MARQARTNPIHQTIPSLCKPTSNKRTRTYPINSKYIKAASTKKNSSQERNAQTHNEDSTEKSCGSHKPSRKTHNLVYADKLHNLLTANINFSARLTHLLSRAEKFPKCYTVLTSKTSRYVLKVAGRWRSRCKREKDIQCSHLSYITRHRPNSGGDIDIIRKGEEAQGQRHKQPTQLQG